MEYDKMAQKDEIFARVGATMKIIIKIIIHIFFNPITIIVAAIAITTIMVIIYVGKIFISSFRSRSVINREN